MTHPIANARFRPIMAPTLAPVIISAAITSVYAVIAPWIPVTVVPTSLATVAIDTFITELSSVIRNWPDASVSRTMLLDFAPADVVLSDTRRTLVGPRVRGRLPSSAAHLEVTAWPPAEIGRHVVGALEEREQRRIGV